MFRAENLWPALRKSTERALATGDLRPLATRTEIVEDGGVRFVVRVLDSIARKREAGRSQRGNPFLPYDEAMFVADVSDTHVALLNKFNVIRHHLLIVTRAFEDQALPLGRADFEALSSCMEGIDGLGFYNGGTAAGASQPHKHLQLVPLPLAPGVPELPVARLLDAAPPEPAPVGALPFAHLAARVESGPGDDIARTATARLAMYKKMMESLAVGRRPYNLLVTRDWMMLVRRSHEHFQSVSINALGFAGSLFVRNRGELDLVRRTGPMRILRAVCEAP
jgi:ATP adenylyltransferase